MSPNKSSFSGNESNRSQFEKHLKLEKAMLYVKVKFAGQSWSPVEVRTVLDGCCFRLKLFLAALCRIIRWVQLTTWQWHETNKRFNLCPILDTLISVEVGNYYGQLGWAWKEFTPLPLPLPLRNSVPLSAPRITSPNWSWQRASLKLSARLTDGIHFSSGLSIKMDSNSPHNFPGRPQKLTLFVRGSTADRVI